MSDVTNILSQVESGDPSAAEKLLPLVYEELRRLAAARMASERPEHTLQATALVHEAYLRLVDNDQAQHWDSRGHFFSAAAEAMRRILVESARHRQSSKRGGDRKRIEIKDNLSQTLANSTDALLDFNQALEQLAEEDPEAAEFIKLRLFAGLSVVEAGRILGMASSTAYENWEFARAWFICRLDRRN